MTFLFHRLRACLVGYRIDIWIRVNLHSTVDVIFAASMKFYQASRTYLGLRVNA